MGEDIFFAFLVGLIFVNAFLYLANIRIEKSYKKISETVKKDMADLNDMIAQNIIILNKIEQAREKRIAYENPDVEKLQAQQWIKEQKGAFINMSYDQFMDWIESGKRADLQDCVGYFELAGLPQHAQIIKVYLDEKGKS